MAGGQLDEGEPADCSCSADCTEGFSMHTLLEPLSVDTAMASCQWQCCSGACSWRQSDSVAA